MTDLYTGSKSTSGSLTSGETISTALEFRGDDDWFSISHDPSQYYSIRVDSQNKDAHQGYIDINIVTSSGEVVIAAHNSSDGQTIK